MQIAVADRDKVDIDTFAKVRKASGKESIHVATVQASKAVSDKCWVVLQKAKIVCHLLARFDVAQRFVSFHSSAK